ncbi:MAG: peptidoglycan DD-metalloendopeptidase family protein [Campylobacterales bacterium]|nr:peptidoglycan DD-metalloendopeptidase family protein [Campylobacterales bacterium]
MVASNGVLLQALIPTGEELQVHLFRSPEGYKLEIIPIAYKKDTYITQLAVESTPYSDIVKYVKNRLLANEFTKVLKNSVNFRGIHKGDRLAIVYDQKMRLGLPIGTPDIKVALMDTKGKRNYVFKHSDQKYYDENGQELIKKYLGKPLRNIRITSPFTQSRFHPVLKRWKAHLGTDFGARRGTPIMAAADGKVVFSGWKGGYGNVVEIQHEDGYKTLYAHQSRCKVRIGQWVKRGEVIGYVGSSGRSTGPHLHFGLYKNGRAINPMQMVKFSSKGLGGKGKAAFLRRKEKYTKIIDKIFDENRPSYVWNTVEERAVPPTMREFYQKRGW